MSETTAENPAKLIDAIRRAFDGVSLEGGVTLHEARAMDDYEPEDVQQSARTLDSELHWQDISSDKLARFHDVHAFLCTKGFRFYIPAFMVWVLQGRDTDGWTDSTIFSLILPDPDKPWYQERLKHFAALDTAQREAIRQFLVYISSDNYHTQDAKEALERYWAR